MANQTDHRSSKQPSKEAQVKGGQYSHAGSMGTSAGSMDNQRDTDRMNQGAPGQGGQNQGNKNQPSKEAQIKGGLHSRAGGGSGSSSSGGSSGNR